MPSKENSLLPSEKYEDLTGSFFVSSKHVDQTCCVFWPSSMTHSFTTILFPHCFPFKVWASKTPLEVSGRSGLTHLWRVVRVCVSVTIQGRLSHLLAFCDSWLPSYWSHRYLQVHCCGGLLTCNWSFLAKLGRESEGILVKQFWDTCCEPLRANESFPAWLVNNSEEHLWKKKELLAMVIAIIIME